MNDKKKLGRRRIGQPITLTLTDEQRAWIDSRIKPGGTRTEVLRDIVQEAMEQFHRFNQAQVI